MGNSFAAAKKAIVDGADILEADVHMTKDQVLLLNYLPYVEDVKGDRMYFSDYKFEEFQGVVSLEKMIEFIKEKNKKLLLDVKVGKTFYSDIDKALVDLIIAMGAEKVVEIFSFDHVCMKKIIDQSSQIRVGIMYVARLPVLDYLLKTVRPSFVEVCADYLDDEVYSVARENKVEVYGWGTDSIDVLLEYRRKGMKAVTVNDVALVKGKFNE